MIKNQKITTLNLSDNGLGSGNFENIKIISEAFTKNKITTLILSDNCLGDGNADNLKILLEALMKNQTITTIDLSKNGIGDGNKGYVKNSKIFSEFIIIKKNIMIKYN